MKLKIFISVILLFLVVYVFSAYYRYIYEESIDPKVLDKLYVEILKNNNKLSHFNEIYIVPNTDGKRLKKLVISKKCKFISFDDYFKLSQNQIQQMKFIRLKHNMVGKDTISINILLNSDSIPLTKLRYIYNSNKEIWEKDK